MTPEERKAEFLDIAASLAIQLKRLEAVSQTLRLHCDIRAMHFAQWDLERSIENCLVVGRHQVGECLDDEMGFSGSQQPLHKREIRGRESG